MWTGPMAELTAFAILAFAAAFPVSLVWHARRGRMGWALRIATADALLVASVLVILRATLPSGQPASGLDPWTWMPFEDLIRAWPFDRSRAVILGQLAQNVVLFVPLGIALGLLPRGNRTYPLVAVAFAFPLIIETTQLLLPALERGCQSADVVDNLAGLLLGLVAGIGCGLSLRHAKRRTLTR